MANIDVNFLFSYNPVLLVFITEWNGITLETIGYLADYSIINSTMVPVEDEYLVFHEYLVGIHEMNANQ